MIEIKKDDKSVVFEDKEFDIILKLIDVGIDFQKTTYELAKELAIDNSKEAIDNSLKEIVNDEDELKILDIVIEANQSGLINKIYEIKNML